MVKETGQADAVRIAAFSRRVARNPSSDLIVSEAFKVMQAVGKVGEVRIVHSTMSATWREWLTNRTSVEVRQHDECPAPRRGGSTVHFDIESRQSGFISIEKKSERGRRALELLAPQMWTAFLLEAALERVQNASISETELVRETMRARDEERRHIARELHDDLGQSMASLKLSLKWAENIAEEHGIEPIVTELTEARGSVGTMLGKIRDLSHTLYPRILDTLGLVAAVKEMIHQSARHSGMQVGCVARGRERALEKETAVALYRCCQEAVHNTLRHAQATTLKAEIVYSAAEVRVTVEDNGRGFNPRELYDPSGKIMSSGFWTIRQRIADLSGAFRLSTARGQGTVVEFSIPATSKGKDAKRKNKATDR